MTNPKELADLFNAAAKGIEDIIPWMAPTPSWVRPGECYIGESYVRSDYAQQEGMAAAFRGIAAMYEKIAAND